MRTRYFAFLFTLIPVLTFISIERNVHDNTALAKITSQKSIKSKKPNKQKTAKTKQKKSNSTKNTLSEEFSKIRTTNLSDIIMGNTNSENELVLLSSLSCNTCKKFHTKILPNIIQEFKDLKIRIEIFADTAPQFEALKILNIRGLTQPQKHNIVEAYFKNQEKIDILNAKDKIRYVHNLSKDLGISAQQIEEATNDKKLAKEIAIHLKELNSQIKSDYLPTIIMNGNIYKGNIESIKELKEFVSKHIEIRDVL